MKLKEHVILKLAGDAPGFYVTRAPEPVDEPEWYDPECPLLVVVDGPFDTYKQATGYVTDVLNTRRAVRDA